MCFLSSPNYYYTNFTPAIHGVQGFYNFKTCAFHISQIISSANKVGVYVIFARKSNEFKCRTTILFVRQKLSIWLIKK